MLRHVVYVLKERGKGRPVVENMLTITISLVLVPFGLEESGRGPINGVLKLVRNPPSLKKYILIVILLDIGTLDLI